jgi:hypothetical protein
MVQQDQEQLVQTAQVTQVTAEQVEQVAADSQVVMVDQGELETLVALVDTLAAVEQTDLG